MKKALAIALTVALSAPVQAGFYINGNALHNMLQSSETHQKYAAMYFVAGVVDVASDFVVCLPQAVTLGQLRDMVTSHLNDNPAQRHRAANVLILEHLASVWPCAKKGTSL